MSEQQQEQEFHHGTIVGVNAKGADKWQIEVNTGGNYTRKFWTKDKELKEALEGRIGQQDGFLCNVSHWTNQEGKPVRSLWIHEVGATGAPVSAATQQGGTGGQAGTVPRQNGSQEFQRDLSPEAQARIEQFQLRELKGVAWQSTAAVFSGSLEEASSAEATTRLFSQMKLLQQLVFSDIAGDVLTPKEGEDIPF